jgi:hypothetical protein
MRTPFLKQKKYRAEQDADAERSKKGEELQKKAVLLDMVSPPADLSKINSDSLLITK